MDQPLNVARDRRRGAARRCGSRRTQDEMALARGEPRLPPPAARPTPSLRQLDRCAAFDDAVVQLQDRDPLRDQGPFSELAVTGRQWSAASALSDDYLAIDGRLDQIRLRVELALAPHAAAGRRLGPRCGAVRAAARPPASRRRALPSGCWFVATAFARQRIFEVVRRFELLRHNPRASTSVGRLAGDEVEAHRDALVAAHRRRELERLGAGNLVDRLGELALAA